MSLEVEASDVVRLVLQFLKENNLTQTVRALQSETQVTLNTVDNVETFMADINQGRWDAVVPQVAGLKLPQEKLCELYEQIVLELIELREMDTAREMLRGALPLTFLRQEQVSHPPTHHPRTRAQITQSHTCTAH